MNKRFDTGKQPYDASKETQATAPSHKPLDFIRLSSESTRDNPRLLGGTPKDASNYLANLDSQQHNEYNKFRSMRTQHGTEIASEMYPLGHDIHLEYMKEYNKPSKDKIVQKSIKRLNAEVIQRHPEYKEIIAQQAREYTAEPSEKD